MIGNHVKILTKIKEKHGEIFNFVYGWSWLKRWYPIQFII